MAASFIIFALCAGVATAQRPRPTDCPVEIETTSVTFTWEGTSTLTDYVTVTAPPSTWTRTLDSFEATITESIEGNSPETKTFTRNDTTSVVFVPTTTIYPYTCESTATM